MPDDDFDLEAALDTVPPDVLQRAMITNFFLDRMDDSPWVCISEIALVYTTCEPCSRGVTLHSIRCNVSEV